MFKNIEQMGQLEIYMEHNKAGPLPYTIYKRQTRQATYCMISFIRNAQNRDKHRDRNYSAGFQGVGVWNVKGYGFFLWGDEIALELVMTGFTKL